ncbi:MAG: tetratricopeptide repeat protein, partial [Cyanobacteria bacterium J06635_10]
MINNTEDTHAYNEDSWEELCWAISNSEGEFALILAHCNSVTLQQKLTQKLQSSCQVKVREILLDKSSKRLYRTIKTELGEEYPQALIVSGLESVKELDILLKGANQVREEFRKNFPFPVVLWVTDEVLQKLIRIAHDLQTWATTVEFAIATDYLVEVIQKAEDKVFTKVLEIGAGRFVNNKDLNLGTGSPQRIELELAKTELKNRNIVIHKELEAGLEFVLGRDIGKTLEKSLDHYERSLLLLSSTPSTPISPLIQIKRACVLYSIGLSWRTYGALYRNESEQAYQKAQDYFEQCTTLFEQANRLDLVANFINAWGEVLQRQEKWDELETVSNKALNLHQTYPHQFRLARAYGFLAEVMLHKSAVIEAQENAKQALEILDNATSSAENSLSLTIIADL